MKFVSKQFFLQNPELGLLICQLKVIRLVSFLMNTNKVKLKMRQDSKVVRAPN